MLWGLSNKKTFFILVLFCMKLKFIIWLIVCISNWIYLLKVYIIIVRSIGPEYIKIICKHLEINKNIKELNLSRCNLGDEGVKALAEELGQNTGLRKLDISYNNLTASCCQDLGDAIFDNNDLMDYNLSGNNFKENGKTWKFFIE